ncbi:universal stress protein [Paenarthrobacter sp. DKR-5]|uniref:universal stress protein n=1 Tax=Paenarthrobacter sp. DKR-5 TaxID=2835535 RepID=UPI001BDD2389|nr:universal stress protein [Paenarthrobacter sp. DKR-5]MBT1001436.1 universal stress protein [Paenarthrobacter sp. DKR-5]
MDEPAAAARVVVGVDGSAASVQALRLASRLAPALETTIEAVACWDSPRPLPLGRLEEEMERVLGEAVERAFGSSPPAALTSSVVRGHPAEVLLEKARGARLLILGRRGQGGFRGLLLGSVSSACVEHAACPVLVVHDQPTEPAAK